MKIAGYTINSLFIAVAILGFIFKSYLGYWTVFFHGVITGILFLGLLIYTIDEFDNYRNKKRSK